MTKPLDIADFTPHLGTAFTIPFASGGRYALVLDATIALRNNPHPGVRRAPLDLRLKGRGPVFLRQGTDRLSHADTEPVEIFITAIDADAGNFIYQEIFN